MDTPSQSLRSLSEPIFDHIADMVFFIKDTRGRYVTVNTSLAKRLGYDSKEPIIGKMASEIFPSPLGEGFSAQDLTILKTGVGIYGRLELHLYPNGKQGWALTYKEPIHDADGKIIGISGLSRDVHEPTKQRDDLAAIDKVIQHVRENIGESILIPQLAKMAGISVYQLDQKIKQLYSVTTGQFIIQTRVEEACRLLQHTDLDIVNLALDCGYSDQSAFTRQFRQTTGVTPAVYRKQYRK